MCALIPDFSQLEDNPIKVKRNAAKISVAELSRRSGVDETAIRDIEKGLPASVPFKLRQFFDIYNSGDIFDTKYQAWRRKKRSLIYLPPVESLRISRLEKHPFRQYREDRLGWSLSQFCEYLCIPRFVLSHYEQNQRSMPRILRNEALPQAHLSSVDVDRLANLGEVHYLTKETIKNEQAKRG